MKNDVTVHFAPTATKVAHYKPVDKQFSATLADVTRLRTTNERLRRPRLSVKTAIAVFSWFNAICIIGVTTKTAFVQSRETTCVYANQANTSRNFAVVM